jgi:ankyrin repeat protein
MPRNKRKRNCISNNINSYKRMCKNPESSPNIIDELKYHLDNGVNPNYCKTIMNKFIDSRNIEGIKILISHGYDLSFCLLKAIKSNNYEISKLLLKNGAYPNPMEPCNGDTPLHISIRSGNDHLTKLLIKYGCNTDISNMCGHTPLMVSIKLNHTQTVKYLLNYCNPNLSTYIKTRSGIKRYHNYFKEVILFGDMEIFRILIPYTSLDSLYMGLKLVKEYSISKSTDVFDLKQLKIELIQEQILKIKLLLSPLINFDILNSVITYLS